MSTLTPEQVAEVRMLAAKMIGQALRDLRPAADQTTRHGDTQWPIGSMEPQVEASLRLECLRLALDQHRFGMGPGNASDEIVDVARKFHQFIGGAAANGFLASNGATADE